MDHRGLELLKAAARRLQSSPISFGLRIDRCAEANVAVGPGVSCNLPEQLPCGVSGFAAWKRVSPTKIRGGGNRWRRLTTHHQAVAAANTVVWIARCSEETTTSPPRNAHTAIDSHTVAAEP